MQSSCRNIFSLSFCLKPYLFSSAWISTLVKQHKNTNLIDLFSVRVLHPCGRERVQYWAVVWWGPQLGRMRHDLPTWATETLRGARLLLPHLQGTKGRRERRKRQRNCKSLHHFASIHSSFTLRFTKPRLWKTSSLELIKVTHFTLLSSAVRRRQLTNDHSCSCCWAIS